MVEVACRVPIQTIADNAGKDGVTIVEQLLEKNDRKIGYDALEHRFVNMVEVGIVDPTKVVRTALEDAASVAALMTTTEAMIVLNPEKEKASPMPAGGMDMY